MNSAIYSPNGGSVGIGFAIPANLAKGVIGQLKDHGNVNRGWLGVKIQTVTPEIAQAMGLESHSGALVTEVTPESPAAKAGIRPGDVILEYDGKFVETMRHLTRYVAVTRAGNAVKITLWRETKRMSVSVKIGQLEHDKVASADVGPKLSGGSASSVLGVELAILNDDAKAQLNLPSDTNGVVIASVDPNGRAASAGLRPGDVIEKIGKTTVKNPADVKRALTGSNRNSVLLLVNRGGEKLFVGINLAGA